LLANYCPNSAASTLVGSPAGGTFTTTAPTGLLGNVLDPSLVPTGITYTVTYTYTNANGCTIISTQSFIINASPAVGISGLSGVYCANAAPVTLIGSPGGGVFTTTAPSGLSGNILSPSLVPTGTLYSITYTVNNGCVGTNTQSFLVNPLPAVSAGTYAPVCTNSASIALIGSPLGGTFSGTGVTGNIFSPIFGTQTITYSYTNANGCTGSNQTMIIVNPLPVVNAGTYAPVCINAAPITLLGSPAGGTFTGIGITGNTFNPAVGTQNISYTFTNANGCTGSSQTTITVNPLPVVSAGTYAPVCSNAALIPLIGSPAGGTFSGTGVTGNSFNPAVGTQTITYTFTDANGCANSAQTTITVNPLPIVSAGTYTPVCINATPITLTGSPIGGTFSGTGVIGNIFNPAVGTQTITYTFTAANGCTGSSQTTITVNPLPVVNAGTYAPVCINAVPITLIGSPVGGTFSGTGVTGNTFNPAVGTQTISYTFTNANGCAGSSQTTITVNPLPVVSAGTYTPVCINAPPITLTGSPVGGIFSGIGVTGNTFNPAVGTQTITYTFTAANGCTGSSQTTIIVNPLPVVSAGTYAPICINNAPITLTGSPIGGTFSGTGVTGNTFNPAVGTQTITYTFTNANGCTGSSQTTITVNPLPVVNAGTYAAVCSNAAPITLTGSPVGGTFSGTGVTGNTFNPAVGTQIITYTFTNANGCANSAQTTITVNPLPVVSSGTYAAVCINAAPITLTGSPIGGTFSGTGVTGNTFNPAVGTQTITYTFTAANGCVGSSQTTITVNPLPVVSAGTYAAVCINAAPITLTGSPIGGTFSGTGVTGNTFNPAVGTQTITYTFTNANGCTGSSQTTIKVNPLPVVNAGTYAAVCINAAPITLIGSPVGGIFSGTGVSGNTFNPAVGTQTITYTFTAANGCVGSSQTTITVNPLPVVNAGTYAAVCINAAPITLTGSPIGGTFSGTGVTGNTFNPAVGTQTITYTFTAANGCVGSSQTTITVNPLPVVNAGTYAAVCSNAAPITLLGSPAGGTFSGTGVTGNTFNPAVGTQTITYTFTNANGCTGSSQTTITVNPLPVVSAGTYDPVCINAAPITLIGSPVGGTFSGTGVTGNTFNPAVGTQTITYTFTNANGCTNSNQSTITVNPLPIVSAGTYAPVCLNAAPITLIGSPVGGIFSGTGVTGNTFNPAVGTQTITYTFTNANGCTGSSQTTITVNPLPVVNAGTYAPVCINAVPVTLIGSPISGIFSGTGVTGNTFNPAVGTQTITYTFTNANGCTGSSQTTITVNLLPVVNAGTYAPVCINAVPVTLTGSPIGGTFSGTGVLGNTFNPAVGTQTITYTFTNANGCTGSSQTTITVNPLPVVNAGTYDPVCINAAPVTLTGSPTGGTFSGTGVTGNIFNPAVGTQTITYTFTTANGCTDSDQITITVDPLPVVNAGTYDPVCINAAPITLTGSPVGGVFSGIGVTGNTFNPAVGTQTITYTFTNANGCAGSNQTTITVNPAPIVSAGTYPPLCMNAAPITLTGSPAGGTFSGIGVTGNSFNPAVGAQIITYTLNNANGCASIGQTTITVIPLPIVSAGTYASVCINAAPITLIGSPAGGIFSGTGVTGNSFNPAVGTQIITYTFTTVNGCIGSSQTTITVNPLPIVSAGTYAPACINAAPITLTGSPIGGIFSGTGVTGNTFNPAVGTQTITYNFTNANGCSSSSQTTITVNPLPVVSAGVFAPICINAAPIPLIGSPAGGTYTGIGVTGNSFNPAVGTQTITYTFTNANGCTASNQTAIMVIPTGAVNAGLYAPLCINAPSVALVGTPVGGTFSGIGVTGNSFNPAVGTQTITYSVTNANGCVGSSQTTIIVNPLPVVSVGTYAPICIDAAPIALIGSPAGGTFSGIGVTGNTFNPAVGTQTITYSFTNTNGCSNSSQTTITVGSVPVVNAGTYAPVCINAAPVVLIGSPAGGIFSGTGVTGNSFDPSVGTQTITYTFTDNGCTNSSQTTITVNPIPVVDAGIYAPVCISAPSITLIGSPAGGTFSGIGVTGNSFNPAAGTQTVTYTVTNANGCTNTAQTIITVNPPPSVNAGTYSTLCSNSSPITLIGSPAGGTFSGVGVTGNIFDPSVGPQTITYTFTDLNGCTNSDQTLITVYPLLVVNAGTYPAVCINAPNLVLTGFPSGGTFSGIGVTGNTFDPAVGSQTITYSYTNSDGCSDSDDATITVNPIPTVDAGVYPGTCPEAADIVLSGTPAGGVFSGIGVSGNLFDPSVGTQTITYTFSNTSGCSNTAQTTITILPTISVDAGTYAAVCPDGASISLSGTPVGGIFTGLGVTNNSFDPAAGTQTITYTLINTNGCTSTDQTEIIVYGVPNIDAGTYPETCLDGTDIVLEGTPSGGVFSGIGVVGNSFDPSVGTQTITYTFTTTDGCTSSDQTTITSILSINVGFTGLSATYCTDAGNVTLVGNPAGGTFTTNAPAGLDGNILIVNQIPTGTLFDITYNYTSTNGCSGTTVQSFLVHPLPVVQLIGLSAAYCADALPVTLSGTPANGIFTTNAPAGLNGNIFTPADIPPSAPYTMTYNFTDGNGCTGSANEGFIVNPLPIVDAGTYQDICADAQGVLLTGLPNNGIFSGIGVSGNTFDPSVGTQTINYAYIDPLGCTNTDTATITVNPLPTVSFNTLAPSYCSNDDSILLIGNPTGGVFSASLPDALINGNTTPAFQPNALLPNGGSTTLTYTYQSAQGCSATAEQIATVNVAPKLTLADTLVLCGGSGEVVALPNAPDQSYLWSTGATTQSISVTQDGTYSVAVTGPNNCVTKDTAAVFIAAGQQFISNLLVSNTACVGDTVHYFDISEVLTGVDSYFWTFGDGATSLLRDPVHIYTNPGAYEVALTATSLECENVSVAKTIQIQSCKQSSPDDIFDLVKVYPNPTEDAFQVDISLNEAKNLLVTLGDINGRILENRLLQDRSLYQIGFSGVAPGVYFVKIQGETQSVVVKVMVF
jgi:Secretion system C-terminal sorting domain/PKD domain